MHFDVEKKPSLVLLIFLFELGTLIDFMSEVCESTI